MTGRLTSAKLPTSGGCRRETGRTSAVPDRLRPRCVCREVGDVLQVAASGRCQLRLPAGRRCPGLVQLRQPGRDELRRAGSQRGKGGWRGHRAAAFSARVSAARSMAWLAWAYSSGTRPRHQCDAAAGWRARSDVARPSCWPVLAGSAQQPCRPQHCPTREGKSLTTDDISRSSSCRPCSPAILPTTSGPTDRTTLSQRGYACPATRVSYGTSTAVFSARTFGRRRPPRSVSQPRRPRQPRHGRGRAWRARRAAAHRRTALRR